MTTHRLETKSHNCQLPDEPLDIVKMYIDAGAFVDFRRKLKRFFMISPDHPLCRVYIKSFHQLKREEMRHLINDYYMIHPFSIFHLWFKFILSLTLALDLFFWPIAAPFYHAQELQEMFTVGNIFYVMLIVLSFFVGYYDGKHNDVILDFRKVAVRYLKTYFIFDLLALSPVFLRLAIIVYNWDEYNKNLSRIKWIISLFRFTRYIYLLESLKETKLYFQINHYVYLATKIFINFTFSLIFLNCVMFIIVREIPEYEKLETLENVESFSQIFFMVSHGHHYSDHIADKIVPVTGIMSGFFVHLVLHVSVMQLWYQYSSAENKQISVYGSLGALMRFKALPVEMRKRIFLYLHFKYQNHYYKDSSVLLATSAALIRDVLIKTTREYTQKVEVFQKFPERVLDKIRTHLTSSIFLPGDMIIKEGSKGKNMFFIINGTVQVVTANGKEICRLRDGGHFGEISLVLNLPRVANVIAVTPCELFRLSRKHFLDVLKQYPELLNDISSLATQRISELQYMLSFADQKTESKAVLDLPEDKEFEIIGEDL